MKNKWLIIITTVIVAFSFIGPVKATLKDDITAVKRESTKLTSIAINADENCIPYEYGYKLQKSGSLDIINNVTNANSTTLNYWTSNIDGVTYKANQNWKRADSSGSLKNYSVRYESGKYKGQKIYVKATVEEYAIVSGAEKSGHYPIFRFHSTNIGIGAVGLAWVKIKYEFFKDSGMTQSIEVKGNTTYWDVDSGQGIILYGDNRGLYAASFGSNNLRKSVMSSGKIFIHDVTFQNKSDDDKKYAFTETFEGATIHRVYVVGQPICKKSVSEDGFCPTSHATIIHSASPVCEPEYEYGCFYVGSKGNNNRRCIIKQSQDPMDDNSWKKVSGSDGESVDCNSYKNTDKKYNGRKLVYSECEIYRCKKSSGICNIQQLRGTENWSNKQVVNCADYWPKDPVKKFNGVSLISNNCRPEDNEEYRCSNVGEVSDNKCIIEEKINGGSWTKKADVDCKTFMDMGDEAVWEEHVLDENNCEAPEDNYEAKCNNGSKFNECKISIYKNGAYSTAADVKCSDYLNANKYEYEGDEIPLTDNNCELKIPNYDIDAACEDCDGENDKGSYYIQDTPDWNAIKQVNEIANAEGIEGGELLLDHFSDGDALCREEFLVKFPNKNDIVGDTDNPQIFAKVGRYILVNKPIKNEETGKYELAGYKAQVIENEDGEFEVKTCDDSAVGNDRCVSNFKTISVTRIRECYTSSGSTSGFDADDLDMGFVNLNYIAKDQSNSEIKDVYSHKFIVGNNDVEQDAGNIDISNANEALTPYYTTSSTTSSSGGIIRMEKTALYGWEDDGEEEGAYKNNDIYRYVAEDKHISGDEHGTSILREPEAGFGSDDDVRDIGSANLPIPFVELNGGITIQLNYQLPNDSTLGQVFEHDDANGNPNSAYLSAALFVAGATELEATGTTACTKLYGTDCNTTTASANECLSQFGNVSDDGDNFGAYSCTINYDNSPGDENNPDPRKVIYRTIDLRNPFPGKSGTGRKTGYNWCSNEDGVLNCTSDTENQSAKVYSKITKNRNVDDYTVYTQSPLYSVELDGEIINDIQENYNDVPYDSWDTYEYGVINGKQVFLSNFLRGSHQWSVSGICITNPINCEVAE